MSTEYENHNTGSVSDAMAWDTVLAHQEEIERLVGTAVGRGLVAPKDRDDATANATLTAFQLAKTHVGGPEEYVRHLRYVLSRRLHGPRSVKDALEHTVDTEVPENVSAGFTPKVFFSRRGGKRVGAGRPVGTLRAKRCKCGKHTVAQARTWKLRCQVPTR